MLETKVNDVLKDIKVRVGVVPCELSYDFKECKTTEEQIKFLEDHKNEGCELYENLAVFQYYINDDRVNTEDGYVFFIPYEA